MIEKVFAGNFITVTVDNGIERVFLKGSVHTFLITDEKRVRITVEKKLGEDSTREKIQGGCLEENEDPLLTAKRELLEELGLEAAEWQHFLTQESAGTVNDSRHYFIARKLTAVSADVDGEIVGTQDYSLEELYEKAMSGEFSPMTQAAIARLHFDVSRGVLEL